MKKALFIFSTIVFCNVNAQNTTYVHPALVPSAFDIGSHWIYEDQATGDIDSVYVSQYAHGFLMLPPVGNPSYLERHSSLLEGSTLPAKYEQRVVSGGIYFDVYNSTTQYYGQPAYYWEAAAGDTLAGTIWMEVLDSMQVKSEWYYNVQHTLIRKSLQWHQVYSYDTDLYYVNGIGIIRRQWTDTTTGISHSFDLVRKNVTLTSISEFENMRLHIYPNPAIDDLTIELPLELANQPVILHIYDVCGREVAKKAITSKSVLISKSEWNLQRGIYLVQVTNAKYTLSRRMIIQ